MTSKKAALLIGNIAHARQEWQSLSSLLTLKSYPTGTRSDFLSKLSSGAYDDVHIIYRSNESTSITGPFNDELVSQLPANLKYICHNGAGYDNIDVPACTKREIKVSSTPIAVNDATADVAMFLMLGALRRVTVPFLAVREGGWRGKGFGLGHGECSFLLFIPGVLCV